MTRGERRNMIWYLLIKIPQQYKVSEFLDQRLILPIFFTLICC